jgi:hypothetical protein
MQDCKKNADIGMCPDCHQDQSLPSTNKNGQLMSEEGRMIVQAEFADAQCWGPVTTSKFPCPRNSLTLGLPSYDARSARRYGPDG